MFAHYKYSAILLFSVQAWPRDVFTGAPPHLENLELRFTDSGGDLGLISTQVVVTRGRVLE